MSRRFPLFTSSYSWMRRKGSRFTLGSGDWGCVRSTLRLRSQPSAAVRVRATWPCLWCVLQKGHFWRLQASRSLVSRGRRGTSWHSDVFHNVSKKNCVAGAVLFLRFQKMSCIFRGKRSTLDKSVFILRGRRSILNMSCGSFFANRIVRAASSGDHVQIPWQAWHFVRCDENWRKPRTKHWFWGSNFWVHQKTRRKMSILKLQGVKTKGSLARNARFDAPTCLASLWFSCGIAVSVGEAAKTYPPVSRCQSRL